MFKMEHKNFTHILQRYLRGEATPSEKNLIEAWYASLNKHVSDQDIPSDAQLEELYRKTIYKHIRKSNFKGNVRRFLPRYATAIAALFLVTLSVYFFFVSQHRSDSRMVMKTEIPEAWKHIANTTQHQQIIFLPDNSKVILQPESNLKFETVFNTTKREVYLEGEASFEVTHNAALPFLVYANEVTTKVLGTCFIVRAVRHEQKITVAVKTGKVSVYADRKKDSISSAVNEIILTPNQQIIYDKTQRELSKTLVEKPRAILPQEEIRRMRFEDAPVTEIFEALEKAYGVEIEFDETIFSSCAMTTVIADDDFYNRLDIICDALGVSYSKDQDRIVISGSGCNAKIW